MSRVHQTHIKKRTIKPLPQTLIDQIAAGEVVERPASVVKELVENALDAGASRVEIHLTEGGMQKIQIIDDGCGMVDTDLPIALHRHTTSKIAQLADLEKIGSYGFRGEALSSIASVSKVTLKSRTAAQEKAAQIQCERGEMTAPKSCAGAVGTSVSVEQLFDKIPARQKFLRSASTEFSHCARVLKEIALGRPSVSFALYHQGRTIQSYRASDKSSRVAECLKPKWVPMHLENEGPDFSLDAFLSPPEWISDKGELLWIINQRCVRHRSFQSAIRNAYRDTLGPHHVPSGVIYLEIRPDWIDVNVHPQKTEVRILKQERLYPFLVSLVRKSISQARTLREVSADAPDSRAKRPPPVPIQPASTLLPPRPTPQAPASAHRRPVPQLLFEDDTQITRHIPDIPASEGRSSQNDSKQNDSKQNDSQRDNAPHSDFRYLGQAKASYLVCEDQDGLLLVDQHALHEKLFFEQLCQKLEQENLEVQKLLVPKIIPIEVEWITLIEEHRSTLKQFGFEMDIIGDAEVSLKTRPSLIDEKQTETVVKEILRELGENPSVSRQRSSGLHQALRPLLATISCHSVIRANHSLSRPEAESLLADLDTLELGQTCPHGRPVMFRLGYKTIEKHFER